MQQHVHRFLLLAVACIPVTAFAHSGEHTSSFLAGALHPLTGLDHLLAMVAVGMLASRSASAERWMLPASFIAAMVVGCLIAIVGVALPLVEGLIAASLLAFGAVLLSARTFSMMTGCALVALFGIFHGHAHGSEMVGDSLMTYGLGFLLSTAALHAAGLIAALRIESVTQRAQMLIRMSGGAIAATGVLLMSGLT